MVRIVPLLAAVTVLAAVAAAIDPVPPPSPTLYRLCGRFGTHFYMVEDDLTRPADGTLLQRFDMTGPSTVLIDSNRYAALWIPSPQNAMWGNGVAYASTMQTRSSWMYPGPTATAYWDSVHIEVSSAGLLGIGAGHSMTVRINGALVKTAVPGGQDRGHHIFVLDPSLTTVVASGRADMYGVGAPMANAYAAAINNQPIGTTVVIGIYDEGQLNINEAVYLALESIGSAHIRQLQFRGAWAIIGRKGAPIGSVPEVLSNVEPQHASLSAHLDVWRFHDHTSALLAALSPLCPASITVAPPPVPTSAPTLFRLCGRFGDVLYLVDNDHSRPADGTLLRRFDMTGPSPVLIDSNRYAALWIPSPQNAMWGNGVAYASTMQTRSSWMYPGPTATAYWDSVHIEVTSAGLLGIGAGHSMTVRINGVLVKTTAPGGQDRGHNIVLLDSSLTAIGSARADLFAGGAPMANAYADFINSLSVGTTVVIGIYDEGQLNINEAVYLALESIGSAHIRQLQFRGAWAIIGRKGAPIGSVPEVLNNVAPQFASTSLRADFWRFQDSSSGPLASLSSWTCPNL